MTREATIARRARRVRRVLAMAVIVITLSAFAVPTAMAGAPESSPAIDSPLTLDEVCTNPIHFANPKLKAKDSLFDAGRDGSQRLLTRGMGVSLVTDLVTGATYSFKGGFRLAFTFEADGSVRVDGSGTDILAWYFPGDDSELGPGLFDVNGHVTEWYAPDGSFIRATFHGKAIDVCAALEG